MRKHSPVAISVAIALGGAAALANAATLSRFATTTGNPQMTATAPAAPNNTMANSNTSTAPVLKNTSTVDQRDAQAQKATAVTHASGTAPANTAGASSATGTSSTTTGASGNGSTAAGAAFVSGSASAVPVALPGANALTTINGQPVTPVILNGVVGGMTAGGEFIAAEGITPSSNTELAAGGVLSGSVGATTDVETLRSSASLDKVIRTAAAERRKIGRNGQLLQTLAPRTNVNRSNEMPDDGPSPALKGPLSR